MCTAWLILAGTQVVQGGGRDGPLRRACCSKCWRLVQLLLAVSFSALFAASAVAQEKDRRTLILLLLTNLTNSELVLGKLLAGAAQRAGADCRFAAAVHADGPVRRRGLRADRPGVRRDRGQPSVCGSIGSTIALWRDSTYQTLALTVLIVAAWIAAGEVLARGVLGPGWLGISAPSGRPASAPGRPFRRRHARSSTSTRPWACSARRSTCFCWWPAD